MSEIKASHYRMYNYKTMRENISSVVVGYNEFSLFEVSPKGIYHRFGDGDEFMDLTEDKALKITGVDLL